MTLDVASIDAEPGSTVELRDVLLVTDGDKITVGSPNVADAVVVAEVVEHGRGKKVINFKYKAKVRYRRKRGHRQGFTKLSVTEVRIGDKPAETTPRRRSRTASASEEPEAAPIEAETAALAESERASETPAAAPTRRRRRTSDEAPETDTATDRTAARPSGSRLIEIEGIGEVHAKTLSDAGLDTTGDLLEAAGSASGRNALATKTGLTSRQILEWVNRADLMRITGVGSEFSDLLEASGVDTVRELATRVPANLQAKMAEVNGEKSLTRRTPSVPEVEKWVAEAKTLPPMVSH
jgi:ribosomal protein L21